MIPLPGQSDTSVQSPFSTNSRMKIIVLKTFSLEDSISSVLTGETGRRRGYPRFIPRDELDLEEDKQCQYLKDDSLYFRVQVEDLSACKPWLTVTVPN